MSLLAVLSFSALFLCAGLVIHLTVCRFTGGRHFMAKGLLIGCIVTLSSAGYFWWHGETDFVGPYVIFTAWLIYLMAFINLLNSVTLKMLASLYLAPQQTLPEARFENTFNADAGLSMRFDMLIKGGLVAEQPDGLAVTTKGRAFLALFQFIKRALAISR
jgi:hypothetical protein